MPEEYFHVDMNLFETEKLISKPTVKTNAGIDFSSINITKSFSDCFASVSDCFASVTSMFYKS